jgi:hypothetical protein
MRYPMYATVTGAMTVDTRSMRTMKRIEKQQKPQRFSWKMSSAMLCTVELIQRRRCENRTLAESGATVCALASRTNLVLYVGKCLRTRVVR